MERIQELNGGEMAERECPKCHSKKNWKDGVRGTSLGDIQRFICRDCGSKFSEKSYKQNLAISNHQLSVILQEAKKLDTMTKTKTVMGDIKNANASNSELIVNHLWYMNKQGYAEQTIIRSEKLVSSASDHITIPAKSTVTIHQFLAFKPTEDIHILKVETVEGYTATSDQLSRG